MCAAVSVDRLSQRRRSLARRLLACRRGTTAIEFAFVAAPFFAVIVAIMLVGMHYFTVDALEHGVQVASRQLRTGDAQKAGMTYADFRQLLCSTAGSYIKCNSKLIVHVKSGDTFADLAPAVSCLTGGNLTPTAALPVAPVSLYAGTASKAVVVTACYEWDAAGPLWQSLWNLMMTGPGSSGIKGKTQGKTILQVTTTFRTEPYI